MQKNGSICRSTLIFCFQKPNNADHNFYKHWDFESDHSWRCTECSGPQVQLHLSLRLLSRYLCHLIPTIGEAWHHSWLRMFLTGNVPSIMVHKQKFCHSWSIDFGMGFSSPILYNKSSQPSLPERRSALTFAHTTRRHREESLLYYLLPYTRQRKVLYTFIVNITTGKTTVIIVVRCWISRIALVLLEQKGQITDLFARSQLNQRLKIIYAWGRRGGRSNKQTHAEIPINKPFLDRSVQKVSLREETGKGSKLYITHPYLIPMMYLPKPIRQSRPLKSLQQPNHIALIWSTLPVSLPCSRHYYPSNLPVLVISPLHRTRNRPKLSHPPTPPIISDPLLRVPACRAY